MKNEKLFHKRYSSIIRRSGKFDTYQSDLNRFKLKYCAFSKYYKFIIVILYKKRLNIAMIKLIQITKYLRKFTPD